MQNIKIEINGVQRNLEPMENQKKDNCSLFFIEGKWYREVKENDFEILSFRRLDMGFIQSLENGLYVTKSGDSSLTLIQMLDAVKKGYAEIHSVKRISDGEVFTVKNDKEKFAGFIKRFEISDNRIKVIYESDFLNFQCLDQLKRSNFFEGTPTVLLTTHEEIEVTNPNQQIFICHKNFNYGQTTAGAISDNPHNIYFYHEEARDEYIQQNKPVLVSCIELAKAINFTSPQLDLLTQFFKQKII